MSEFDRAPSRMNNLVFPAAAVDAVNRGNTPYSRPNMVMTPAAREYNSRKNGVSYQGYTYNVPIGGSNQNLQLPGDCRELLGVCASWDFTTNPGFNNVLTIMVNNQGILNAIDIAFLGINRFLVGDGYIPFNKIVSETSLLNVQHVNGTAAIVAAFNLIVAYR